MVKKYGADGGGREAARLRAGFVPRYARVLVMLATLMLGTLAVGSLMVVATALPGEPGVQRASAVLGSALAVFAVLLLGARLLLVRPAPFRTLWPGPVLGAALVTVVLNGGASLLAREQERIPAACAEFHLTTQNSPPVPGGPPPAADEPG